MVRWKGQGLQFKYKEVCSMRKFLPSREGKSKNVLGMSNPSFACRGRKVLSISFVGVMDAPGFCQHHKHIYHYHMIIFSLKFICQQKFISFISTHTYFLSATHNNSHSSTEGYSYLIFNRCSLINTKFRQQGIW